MNQAIELAAHGEGWVEPNPMVGCVLVRDGKLIGQGFHEKFGAPHAEINALNSCDTPQGSTAYVTLEPCCHVGKTGPCTDALIEAGVARVVIGATDPFPQVSGKGIEQLKSAGIEVVVGVQEAAAKELICPFVKKTTTGMPWVIAKWAMTLDGKIATTTGESKWISNESSRAIVHQLRGRVDAIIAGIGTVFADDPLLTARPPGTRTALRVIVDPEAKTPMDSQLIKTAREFPVAIAVAPGANDKKLKQLQDAGCTLLTTDAENRSQRLRQLLQELGKMDCTNVLVEGGASISGALNDAALIDEVHAFIGPKLFGGLESSSPIAGSGVEQITNSPKLKIVESRTIDDDVYIVGRVIRI